MVKTKELTRDERYVVLSILREAQRSMQYNREHQEYHDDGSFIMSLTKEDMAALTRSIKKTFLNNVMTNKTIFIKIIVDEVCCHSHGVKQKEYRVYTDGSTEGFSPGAKTIIYQQPGEDMCPRCGVKMNDPAPWHGC